MAGKRITQEQINEMISLYAELKTYSAVARKMGVTATTVSRYIKENSSIKTYDKAADDTLQQPKDISQIDRDSILTFSFLTQEEKTSYENWLKEFE